MTMPKVRSLEDLITTMAVATAHIEELLLAMSGQSGGSGGTGSGITTLAGYPANVTTVQAIWVQIAVLFTAYRLPDMEVPEGMALQIKGAPGNGGQIHVANSPGNALNSLQRWPLLPNEAIGYQVKNANMLYISGTQVNDWAVMTVEKR